MPEQVIVREDLNIIQVISEGEATLKEMTVTLLQVAKLNKTQRFRCVLVDARGVTRWPGTFPIFQFGTRIAAAIHGLKLVIIGRPEHGADLELIADVAVNRGMVVEIFYSEEEAMQTITPPASDAIR